MIIVVSMTQVITQPSSEAEALQKMRDGILLVIIGWVFLGIGILMFVGGLIVSIITGFRIGFLPLIGAVVLVLVGGVIVLVGFYSRFIPGSSDLAKSDPEFSTGATLIKVGYVWGLILLIIGAILTLALIGVFIIIIGYVLLILGFVGMIILSFKLKDKYGNTLYLIAGILFILGIIFAILGVVAWILLYVALGDTIRKLKTQQPTQAFLT